MPQVEMTSRLRAVRAGFHALCWVVIHAYWVPVVLFDAVVRDTEACIGRWPQYNSTARDPFCSDHNLAVAWLVSWVVCLAITWPFTTLLIVQVALRLILRQRWGPEWWQWALGLVLMLLVWDMGQSDFLEWLAD